MTTGMQGPVTMATADREKQQYDADAKRRMTGPL